jgi:hypothetical protein
MLLEEGQEVAGVVTRTRATKEPANQLVRWQGKVGKRLPIPARIDKVGVSETGDSCTGNVRLGGCTWQGPSPIGRQHEKTVGLQVAQGTETPPRRQHIDITLDALGGDVRITTYTTPPPNKKIVREGHAQGHFLINVPVVEEAVTA